MVFKAKDVGKLQRIMIRLVGNKGYRCKTIAVMRDGVSTNFECLRRINPCKGGNKTDCRLEMVADGNIGYEVTIKTSDDDDSSTTSPILLILHGSENSSPIKMFEELGLKSGSTVTKTISTVDLGQIKGYKLMLQDQGKWKPDYIMIKNTGMIIFLSFS